MSNLSSREELEAEIKRLTAPYGANGALEHMLLAAVDAHVERVIGADDESLAEQLYPDNLKIQQEHREFFASLNNLRHEMRQRAGLKEQA